VRRELAFALVASLPATFAIGQQPAASTPQPAIAQPANVTVYYDGPGVTAPLLYPSAVSISLPKHCVQIDGVVKLSALVDENGLPRSIQTLQSDDARLSDFAIGFIAAQRFKAGTHNGVPAAVAIEATLGLQTCWQPTKGTDDGKTLGLTLRSHPAIAIETLKQTLAALEEVNPQTANIGQSAPEAGPGVYKIGANIGAPVLLNHVEAEYSDYARKQRIQGICALSLIVDANGMPQDVHVVKSLEPSLDDNAVDAVKQFRFKPAMKDGTTPVPVVITVEVDFHLYKRKLF
jgi:TonB family protein